ncbi:hypothetical protein [Nocardioides aquiterrae]|uniref:Uncharacterized protein n=1 Tax=Nocardioides aquiterrae TaxID=203799 RepID=A0ABP4FC65_9ACTN
MSGRREQLVAAFREARETGDPALLAEAALALPRGQGFGAHPGEVPAYLHEALLAATDDRTRARLLAGLARAWVYGGEAARAADFAAGAQELAAGLDDPALTADVLDAALLARWGPDDFAERVRLAARLETVSAHLADPEARLTAHLWRLTTAWECLDLVSVRRQLRGLELLDAEAGSPRVTFFARSRQAMHALVAGDLDLAAALLDEVVEVGRTLAEADVEAVVHSLAADLARQRGDTGALRAEAAGFEGYGDAEGIVSVLAEAAVFWLDAGEPDRAGAVVDRLPRPAELPEDVDLLLTVSCVAYVAAATGRADLAAECADVLTPYAGRAVLNAAAVSFHGVVDDALARATDDPSRQAAALAAYRRIGARWWADRLGAPPAAAAPVRRRAHLRPSGETWTVGWEGATFPLPDLRGLHHLRQLLANPGVEVAAADLAGAAGGPRDADLGPVLDDAARRAYGVRLAELDAEIEEADAWSDTGRSERAVLERQALLEELGRATGLAGRDRRSGATAERARTAVRKTIAAVLARVERRDPAFARLLRDTVRTGTVCVAEPDPARPVAWVLSAESPAP